MGKKELDLQWNSMNTGADRVKNEIWIAKLEERKKRKEEMENK